MHSHHYQSFSNGTTRIVANCRVCDEPTIMTVNTPDYYAWQSRVPIQHAMPTLSANERELLISGTCGTCFDKLFASEQSPPNTPTHEPK